MEHDEFVTLVGERLDGVSPDAAERAVRATLETLGQRLPAEEAEDLAAQLPPHLATCLHQTASQHEEFPVDEFYERVAELEDIDPDEATAHAKAVLGILDHAVSSGQIAELMMRLPSDYGELLAEAAS